MIDYTIVILQLSLLMSLVFISVCAVTIIGTSVGLWLISKSLDLCCLAVDLSKDLYLIVEKKAKLWVS